MRFMMLMIPSVYANNPPAGLMPDPQAVRKMMRYNRTLEAAGALLSLDGLHPPSEGARVVYSSGKGTVTRPPFAGVKEALGGYWIIEAGSLEEAIAWAEKVPAEKGDVVEVRQIQEVEDFPSEVRRAVEEEGFPPGDGRAKEVAGLERAFWQAMKEGDLPAMTAMVDDPCVVTGPMGVHTLSPAAFQEAMRSSQSVLKSFAFKGEPVATLLGPDTAVVAYEVHEEVVVEGRALSLEVADSSTWVRRGGKWLCALHSEAFLGDPYGRDRKG